MRSARIAFSVSRRLLAIILLVSAAAYPARAADIDAATPDYLRPLDNRAAIETAREPDARLTVRIHGERFDGRRLVASLIDEAWRGAADRNADFDLHMEITTLAGFDDETLNAVDLMLSRRGGRMSQFSLSARTAHDAPLRGGLRTRKDGQPLIVLESGNAGALLRFAGIFAPVTGGHGGIAIELRPSPSAKRDGILTLRDFGLPEERLPQDFRSAAVPPSSRAGSRDLEFSSLHVNYSVTPGKLTISRALLYGPLFGATLEGLVDGDNLDLRGQLLPRVLAQAEPQDCRTKKGCLLGMPFRVQGKLQAPQIRIMPYVDMSNLHLFDDIP